VVAYDRNLNLEDLLFKYGVRINPDLIMDLQCDFLPFDVNGKGHLNFYIGTISVVSIKIQTT